VFVVEFQTAEMLLDVVGVDFLALSYVGLFYRITVCTPLDQFIPWRLFVEQEIHELLGVMVVYVYDYISLNKLIVLTKLRAF
jgi:hypothetical protein